MVYGHGVSEKDALPAALQRLLNQSTLGRAFECLNEGVCGYSIHTAWDRFLSFGYRYQPNLVLLLVSHNDIELKQTTVGKYQAHIERIWNSESLELKVFHARSAEIKRGIQSRFPNTRFALLFYDNPPWRMEDRMDCLRQEIANAAEQMGIPFIDVTRAFDGMNEASEVMVASEIDWHPSAVAHERAARYIARSLFANKLLDSDGGNRIQKVDQYRVKLLEEGREAFDVTLYCSELAGQDDKSVKNADLEFLQRELRFSYCKRLFDDGLSYILRIGEDCSASIENWLGGAISLKSILAYLRICYRDCLPWEPDSIPSPIVGCKSEASLEMILDYFKSRLRTLEGWLAGPKQSYQSRGFRDAIKDLRAAFEVMEGMLECLSEIKEYLEKSGERVETRALRQCEETLRSWYVWMDSWQFPGFLFGMTLDEVCKSEVVTKTQFLIQASWGLEVPAFLSVRCSSVVDGTTRMLDTRYLLRSASPNVYVFESDLSYSGEVELLLRFACVESMEGATLDIDKVIVKSGAESLVVAEELNLVPEKPQSFLYSTVVSNPAIRMQRITRAYRIGLEELSLDASEKLVVYGANEIGLALFKSLQEDGYEARIVDSIKSGVMIGGVEIGDPQDIENRNTVILASPSYEDEMKAGLKSYGHVGTIVPYPVGADTWKGTNERTNFK